jgi:hypothetical protein
VAINWTRTSTAGSSGSVLQRRAYTCGYCDRFVGSDRGYVATKGGSSSGNDLAGQTCICPYCQSPTYFSEGGDQTPGSAFGGHVDHVASQGVENLYEEARNCMKVSAYTAAVMCCRKLLMNVAVSEGAEEGKSFAYYVRYLADEGHIPPKAEAWVDHIRDKGNEANHEIQIMSREDAERLVRFSEMLLRIMYEYPAEVAKPS